MANVVITEETKQALKKFLRENRNAELVNTYLCFIESKYKISPVLFPKEKTIFLNTEDLVRRLEKENKLWHETEIKITFSDQSVNEETKKIYICPFTGKVFGDNTHPNPQDAIYEWVTKCPENTERIGGVRVKRFFVSEDPDVIKSYAAKNKAREPIVKVVFSSVLSGKLFNSKEAVINDFKKNYLKEMSLIEVQGQNRFPIESGFLQFIQEQLTEDNIADFVESLSSDEEFHPYIEQWVE